MCPLDMALAIGLLVGSTQQPQIVESQAINRVQQLPVSQLDPALPGRPFAVWLNQVVGSQAGITWQLTECGEQGEGVSGEPRDIRACVEMTALLPNDRKVMIMTLVGTFNQGLNMRPRLHLAVVEDKGELYDLARLSDLPEMVRRPLVRRAPAPKNRVRPVTLPSAGPARLVLAPPPPIKAETFGKPPSRSVEIEQAPPGKEIRKVSEGVLLGNVINKVLPGYPAIAKQLRLSGEVKVDIVIAEDGRVINAVAVSGPPMLRDTAVDAALKWIFKPTILNGKPVQTQGTLSFIFARQ